jgi:molybdopterin molybdotransferase
LQLWIEEQQMAKAAVGVVSFDEALKIVLAQAADVSPLTKERLPLLACAGRVLAEPVLTDRDQPPFDRSTRDGFAVRSSEFGVGSLTVVGQVRAGEQWKGSSLEPKTTIEIMTGAPIPDGADAVVMVEHVERVDASIRPVTGRSIRSGENIVRRGSEARSGEVVVSSGIRLEGAEVALAAACGLAELTIFRRPTVAIVATGDELVEIEAAPKPQQIRNSNSYGLAALVANAGGHAVRLPIAPDNRQELEEIIHSARQSDLMLLSGGVSMGQYDLVEEVLQSLGAEFYFTGVRMQPGKPVVFGRLPAVGELPAQLFFGLPGNPVSTQVTFHCFVEPLLHAMAGEMMPASRFVQATLLEDASGNPGLMRILPARLSSNRLQPTVRLVPWQGSGDLAANARANCYAVLPPEKERFTEGDVITILLR